MTQFARSRTAGALLTAAIVGLTVATAYIHLTLGGVLFTLNGLGYVGLAAPGRHRRRGSDADRPALQLVPAGRAHGLRRPTIAGYLVMGPYFTLGWIAKGIEVTLIVLVAVDVLRVYGSPMGLVHTALDSVAPFLPERFRPTAA